MILLKRNNSIWSRLVALLRSLPGIRKRKPMANEHNVPFFLRTPAIIAFWERIKSGTSLPLLIHPKFEILVPRPGFYTWKDIWLLSEQEGYALEEKGKVFRTFDGGKSWEQDISGIVFKKDKSSSNASTLQSAPKETASFETTTNAPMITLANERGENWKLMKGLSNYGLFGIVSIGNSLVITDDYGNVFLSKDQGRSFVQTKEGIGMKTERNSYPKLKRVNDMLYYFSEVEGIAVSNDGGKKWEEPYLLPEAIWSEISDLEITADGSAFFIMGQSIYQALGDFSHFHSIYDYDWQIWKIGAANGNLVVTAEGGTLLISPDNGKTWQETRIEYKHMLTELKHHNGVTVINTDGDCLYYSTDLITFNKIIFNGAMQSTESTVYKNYILFDISPYNPALTGELGVYNMDTRELFSGAFDMGDRKLSISYLHENYATSAYGAILKFNPELITIPHVVPVWDDILD
ncbi:hypothetical protein ACE38W_06665 [Chitinophaga sp. Hz27]|uniref:sialidase family protein n=1 Tax=Chitinophaga sp. Hz27 TaxID=3347169 RepID=UPI0035D94484